MFVFTTLRNLGDHIMVDGTGEQPTNCKSKQDLKNPYKTSKSNELYRKTEQVRKKKTRMKNKHMIKRPKSNSSWFNIKDPRDDRRIDKWKIVIWAMQETNKKSKGRRYLIQYILAYSDLKNDEYHQNTSLSVKTTWFWKIN